MCNGHVIPPCASRFALYSPLRKTYRDTDPVGPYTILNIKGNAYRLIVKIEYRFELIFIKRVQTHAEYDNGDWGK